MPRRAGASWTTGPGWPARIIGTGDAGSSGTSGVVDGVERRAALAIIGSRRAGGADPPARCSTTEVAGVWAGIEIQAFTSGQMWLWAAVGVLVVILGAMYGLVSPTFFGIRDVIGRRHDGDRPGGARPSPVELAADDRHRHRLPGHPCHPVADGPQAVLSGSSRRHGRFAIRRRPAARAGNAGAPGRAGVPPRWRRPGPRRA